MRTTSTSQSVYYVSNFTSVHDLILYLPKLKATNILPIPAASSGNLEFVKLYVNYDQGLLRFRTYNGRLAGEIAQENSFAELGNFLNSLKDHGLIDVD